MNLSFSFKHSFPKLSEKDLVHLEIPFFKKNSAILSCLMTTNIFYWHITAAMSVRAILTIWKPIMNWSK
jgi:hypothetical protein